MNKNIIYLIGMGPGNYDLLTNEAIELIKRSDILICYKKYGNLLKGILNELSIEKEFYESGMRFEKERCKKAIEEAKKGKAVSLISSGDSGIYGMAGLLFETLHEDEEKEIKVYISPGITAAVSGAAVLGAPLMNDFAIISLSDHLTPKDKIIKRLRAVSEADMVTVLYNPMSHERPDSLREACDIILLYKPSGTLCGAVKNIGREGTEKKILSLNELRDEKLDMLTTVFIGSSDTVLLNEKLVTKRGYSL